MNTAENKEIQIKESKRHKSTINPSMENIQMLEPNIISNNQNNLFSNTIKLRSNSLFTYQEFDKFTSLFGNQNFENTPSYNSSFSNSTNEEDIIYQDKKKNIGNFFYSPNLIGFLNSSVKENSINNNLSNNINSNNLINNYSNNKYLYNNGYQDIFDLRRNSLGLLNNFLYYNYSFQMPYQQGIPPYLNNSIINNNGQFNSININSFKRNSCSFQKPYIYSQEYYQIFNKLQDQVGCRQLQEKLEEKRNDNFFIQQFYKCIENNLTNVINHQFGNYVAQKLFDIFLAKNNKKMITNFFSKIKNDLIIISLHSYGTRVFQKILEKLEMGKYLDIETDELNNIFKKLIENHILDLCSDINGNHVFQKIVKIYPKEKNNFIFNILSENIIPISKLKQGLTIFENCFLIATKNQKDKVINSIIKDISNLINDEFGNYIIQLLVSFNDKKYNKIIFDYYKENLVELSCKKFSSNVIDRAIIPNCENSLSLIDYMIKNDLIKELIIDQYGNYVVQKALNITKGETFNKLIDQIKPMIEKLKISTIGRKIYDHLCMQYGEYFHL
jgi:hypothetical protein